MAVCEGKNLRNVHVRIASYGHDLFMDHPPLTPRRGSDRAVPGVRSPGTNPVALIGRRVGFERASRAAFGERIAQEIGRDPAYLDDPVLMDYPLRLWSLRASARLRGEMDAEIAERFAWQ